MAQLGGRTGFAIELLDVSRAELTLARNLYGHDAVEILIVGRQGREQRRAEAHGDNLELSVDDDAHSAPAGVGFGAYATKLVLQLCHLLTKVFRLAHEGREVFEVVEHA